MARERFKKTGKGSFFGEYLYERVIPRDHFLVKLNQVVSWNKFTWRLVKYYRGEAKEGRPPYEPALLLKMLLISYLYDLSERHTEQVVNENLPVKWFVGLAADEKAPDHSTLTAFKRRLLDNGKLEAFEEILREVVSIAKESGVGLGTIQVVDSVHSVADVNVSKDEKRHKDGKGRRDNWARWGVKHTRRVKDENGRVIRQKEYFYGYKTHVSLNSKSGLITAVVSTAGNATDGKQLKELVRKDMELGLPVEIVSGDRGYDDGENHLFLEERGIHSAIRLNDYRTQKKDGNKQVWIALQATPEYQEGQKERYKVERKFGEAVKWHGMRRCRYLGLLRHAIQGFMTAIALNLKRIVKVLTGVGFKAGATCVV